MRHRTGPALFLFLALTVSAVFATQLPSSDLESFARSLLVADNIHTQGFKTSRYDPSIVDWSSVMLACKLLGQYERRFHNFNIRSAFHDGLAVDLQANTGGMDASIFTHQEMNEVQNGGFTTASWRVVKTISLKYKCSVADALAVCAAVGVQELSGGRTKIIGPNGDRNFPVGRLDNPNPMPNSRVQIIGPSADVPTFKTIWNNLGFSVEEGVALTGAHALFDNQGCSRSSRPNDLCDPNRQSCINQVRMFKWDVHYFHNACTGTLNIAGGRPPKDADERDLQKLLTTVKCSYSSSEYQQKRSNTILAAWNSRGLKVVQSSVDWNNNRCGNSAQFGVRNNCPHETTWPYTENDAKLGRACQNLDMNQPGSQEVQRAMRRFLNAREWDRVFAPAFIDMVSRFAKWSNGRSLMINGLECRYIVDQGCANSRRMSERDPAKVCSGCQSSPIGSGRCNSCCRCPTAWTPSRDKLVPEPQPFTTPTVFEV